MKSNFTLIELLVVVAIIGILMSLLLPSLSSARQTTKAAVCVSNLKQVGVAIYTYSLDDKSHLPGGLWNGQQAKYDANDGLFGRFLGPEIGLKNNDTFSLLLCPSFTRSISGSSAQTTKQFQATGKNSENQRYFGYPAFNGDPASAPLPISMIEEPSDENSIIENDSILTGNTNYWNGNLSANPRHGFKGGGAYRSRLFFDGHALITNKAKQE